MLFNRQNNKLFIIMFNKFAIRIPNWFYRYANSVTYM